MNNIKNIAVVGGGTAGFVAALILKKSYPSIDVSVIRSKDIGIIGVGEGSTEHWSEFMDFLGIELNTLIQETDATFKSGIMFRNWGGYDYLQSIGDGFNLTYRGYPFVYGSQISENKLPKDLVSPLSWNSRANIWFLGQPDHRQVQQYHFNTHKLNAFLEKLSSQNGINLYDDEILEVKLSDDGSISSLNGKNQTYVYDFYIDCTGFNRVLMTKLNCEWQSYSKYLKMKSALVFPIEMEHDEEIPMWTLAQGMNAGWMFRLPVWGRYGNGYIFDSDHISADQAKQEIDQYFGKDIDVKKQINFDPGALKETWIKNCVAIGLSASFVEPLEASSIGTSIQQSLLLAEHIINYNDASIINYNKECNDILDNIRDFVFLHYLGGRKDTEFWKSIQEVEIPEELKFNLSTWIRKLPSEKDFSRKSEKILFSHFHYILIMHGLGLFDINSIKEEYNVTVSEDKKDEASQIVNHATESPFTTIPHKTMIEVLRNIKTWPNL